MAALERVVGNARVSGFRDLVIDMRPARLAVSRPGRAGKQLKGQRNGARRQWRALGAPGGGFRPLRRWRERHLDTE